MNKISAIQTVICIIGLISCAHAIDNGEYAVIPAAGLMAFLLYRNLVNIKKIDNE